MTNLKNSESNFLKIDKKHYKGIDIYYIGYITIKIASEYIEEKNGNKYLIFDDSVNENKGLLKKYADVWDGIKSEIKGINGGKENNYGKD